MSRKHILADIHDFGLNPNVAHSSVNHKGRLNAPSTSQPVAAVSQKDTDVEAKPALVHVKHKSHEREPEKITEVETEVHSELEVVTEEVLEEKAEEVVTEEVLEEKTEEVTASKKKSKREKA